MALVLCTGVDSALMETRRLILQQAGHKVITVADGRELADACDKYQFDVAVLGQTISSKVKKAMALFIREQCPSARILELWLPYQGKAVEDADSWLEAPSAAPDELAERVDELARKKK
jgi:hypothetical protein